MIFHASEVSSTESCRGSLDLGEGAVGVVDDELRAELGDERELAFADLGGVGVEDVCRLSAGRVLAGGGSGRRFTGPEGAGLGDDEPDVVGALLHLACEVKGRGEDEVGVRAADLDLGVVAPHVNLGGREGLLSDGHALPELG